MDLEKLAARNIADFDFELSIENEEIFDYKQTLNDTNQLIMVLKQNHFRGKKCKLEFASDRWEFYNDISGTTEVIDYKFMDSLIFLKHIDTKKLKIVLKCWVIDRLANDGISASSAQIYFNHVAEAIVQSHGFSLDHMEEYYSYIMSLNLADGAKYPKVASVLNFLSFYDELETAQEYTRLLHQLLNNLKPNSKSRMIPSGLHILRFSNFLEHFFATEDTKNREYLHYLPLLLWWKITTIIPLRPYEFCRITPNCLQYQDDKCYLQLPRLKESGLKKNKRRKQVIDKILIPSIIEQLVLGYIEAVEPYQDTNRKTLISRVVYQKTLPFAIKGIQALKRDDDAFLTPDLSALIERFYIEVINRKYGFSFTNLPPVGRKPKEAKLEPSADLIRVRAIDTRHIAFINMLAQGWSKPEIARFGGHLMLESQANYQNHQEYWIEEETQKLMRKFRLGVKLNKQEQTGAKDNHSLSIRLDSAFKTKFILAPSPVTGVKRKLKLGYCTDPLQRCASHCLHCDFWRITSEEFEEKQTELYGFIKECDNHIHDAFAFLKDLQRIALQGELNPEIANQILSTQKTIDDELYKRASTLYNLERNVVI